MVTIHGNSCEGCKENRFSLNIALLNAKDFVVEPGLFLEIESINQNNVVVTTIPASATQLILVECTERSIQNQKHTKTPPKDKRIADRTYWLDRTIKLSHRP